MWPTRHAWALARESQCERLKEEEEEEDIDSILRVVSGVIEFALEGGTLVVGTLVVGPLHWLTEELDTEEKTASIECACLLRSNRIRARGRHPCRWSIQL